MAATPTASTGALEALVAGRAGQPPVVTGVVHPCDAIAIEGAVQAAQRGLITPILVGPRDRIVAAAAEAKQDISAFHIEEAPHSDASAARAVELVKVGVLQMLMKGSLHTDELMHAVVDPVNGIRTERRVSHVYVMEVSTYPRLLLITDAAVNIAPDLEAKRDITQNAIDLAQAIGVAVPKVAVLSAVETVTSKMQSTIDAASLCKMADRGQITGGLVEGPLAFDNAVNIGAAREKHLTSPVAGQADIVVCPDLESGNMLAKQLTYLAGARSAAVVLGARVPIALTSRADSILTHVASCALGSLLIQQRRDALKVAAVDMAADAILALNAGSSSLKFALFERSAGKPREISRGEIEDANGAGRFRAHDATGAVLIDQAAPDPMRDAGGALAALLDWTDAHLGSNTLACVGHRIVHGGREFVAPVRLDDQVMTALEAFCPLAPLHQPHNLAGVRAVARARPTLPQTASFDTAFHAGHDATVARFAIPRRYEAEGVRRYGFHGLSYDYISGRLAALDPALAKGRVIAAHLGNGASLCALANGKSVDTTMGFSALDGLVMGTRCGAIDPGVLLYLQDHDGLDSKGVSDVLYKQSGLLGVSGISSDVRVLLASNKPEAREALDLFAFRAAREAGGLVSTLSGLDGLVFSAGIGENAVAVRAAICERLAWLGVALDPAANAKGGEGRISTPDSRVAVWIVPTDEEAVIVRDAVSLLG